MIAEMWESLTTYVVDVGTVFLLMPVNASEKFYLLYIATFIGLAFWSYRKYYKHRTRRHFFQFLFPKRIYAHPSARVDYWVFLINILLSPLLLVFAGLQALLSSELATALMSLNEDQALVAGEWGYWTFALFILGYTMAADFSVYLVHRVHHASNTLWPLHALHHSAEVMTPVTLFRKHPLWNVITNVMHLSLTGLFQGIFLFFFLGNPGVEVLFGINSIYMLYNFFGANLRHSHVWLSWGDGRIGQAMSRVFISPAMHQIHHDPKRMNYNFGEVFALWDWMFGTLHVPKKYEEFAIGLGEEGNPHDSVWRAYWVPVRQFALNIGGLLLRRDGKSSDS